MNRNLLARGLALFAGLFLTACAAVGPDYTAPTMNLPENWNQGDLSTVYTTASGAPDNLSHWWQNLGDQLLSSLIAEALQSSPDVQSARAKLREARARYAVATSGYYPTVSASGTASRSESSRETGSGSARELYSAGFDASWELDVFGGTRRSVEASEADLAATEANLHGTQVSLAAEVATNYVQVRSLQTRLNIAKENFASQTETLQLTEWRAQAGLVSRQDVEQARSNREQTRAQIPVLETSLIEAEHRLDILLGQTPGTLRPRLATTGKLPAVPKQIALKIPADTLRQRPDVMAAERKLAAETARVGVAEAARYPSFKISGSIGLEALTLSGLGNSGANTSSLLGNITAPVFNAGRLRSQVQVQDAVREQAQVAYEQAVRSALQDVENALVALARNSERTEALAIAAESSANAAQMARQRYTAGLIDFQAVLDTDRSVRSAEDSLAVSRSDSVLALISLYKALGGGWSPQAASDATVKESK